MEKMIESIDRLLAEISVSRESVLLMADARRMLAELYKMAKEKEKGEQA